MRKTAIKFFSTSSSIAIQNAIKSSQEAVQKLQLAPDIHISSKMKVSNPRPGNIPTTAFNEIKKGAFSEEKISNNEAALREFKSGW